MNGRAISQRTWGRTRNSLRTPTVLAAKKRGVIRLDVSNLTNPCVTQLSDSEWRAYISLLPWFARYSQDDGEVPREWLEGFSFGPTHSGRPRRITANLLARLIKSGLVEEFEYDDGSRTLAIVGWRDFRSVDLTSAERKRRYRKRLYGDGYYGTEGDVMEVDFSEIAALEAKGRAIR